MKTFCTALFLCAAPLLAADTVRTATGPVSGAATSDGAIRVFKGIPYAAPPVGALRWQPPQPAAPWKAVRQATAFGARCMQGPIYPDMVFRDAGPSEDCLYLNVWAPAKKRHARLPVMVWIYGGGFAAGGSSEPRQDGENLARKGVVVVSMNYRLGVFGFFAHPELAKESPHSASGNYGLLDQTAALDWVKRNIAAFGGDPSKVTIFGESAGSFSVSAQMASPLAKGLFARAIGESGAMFGATLAAQPLDRAARTGAAFAESVGAHSLADLRAKPAAELLEAAMKKGTPYFSADIDGWFLPESPLAIFASGQQSHVPLLAGWNADEGTYRQFFAGRPATAENFAAKAQTLFGARAGRFLEVYAAPNDEQAKRAAADYGGDLFIGFSTWKWIEAHAATGGSALYRYEFDDAPPPATPGGESRGAYHSAEIEFVFGALASKSLPWRPEDKALSELMMTYWSNFAKTGDPNGEGLPPWPVYAKDGGYPVMHLDFAPHAAPDIHRARYEFLDAPPATTTQ